MDRIKVMKCMDFFFFSRGGIITGLFHVNLSMCSEQDLQQTPRINLCCLAH